MEKYDVTVIGAGPGGYVAAIRAAQLGSKVLLVEKEKVGGVCMNWGCIPTKYLIHRVKGFHELQNNPALTGPKEKIFFDWTKVQEEKSSIIRRLTKGIEFILKKNGVNLLSGKAVIIDKNNILVETKEGENRVKTERIILATGSRPASLPFLETNGREILNSRHLLEVEKIPSSLIIIGAGAIGLEMGMIFRFLGSKVIVLEIMPTILPGSDESLSRKLERILKRKGMEIHTRMKINEAEIKDGKVIIRGLSLTADKEFSFEAEKVLLAAGRKPNSEMFYSSFPSIDKNSSGFIPVNPAMETQIPGIYAVGDVVGGKLLAHKASHEGLVAAENACGRKKEMSYQAIPSAVFTEPEFASVGLTEKELKEKGLDYKSGQFSLQASGRAVAMGETEGLVKVLTDKNGKIIGAHILSPHASELISELALAMEKGLSAKDVGSVVHIHPTLSESIMEASLQVTREAIHVVNE